MDEYANLYSGAMAANKWVFSFSQLIFLYSFIITVLMTMCCSSETDKFQTVLPSTCLRQVAEVQVLETWSETCLSGF